MADPVALRVRRSRLHKAGDHSLCKRCAVVRGEGAPLAPVRGLPPARLDAAAELRALAARLAAAHERDPANALLARELRATLLAIPEERPAGNVMDELRQMASRVS